jgi:hypothetical protein
MLGWLSALAARASTSKRAMRIGVARQAVSLQQGCVSRILKAIGTKFSLRPCYHPKLFAGLPRSQTKNFFLTS